MENILKEISDKQDEIDLLYTKLRRSMRLHKHKVELLNAQKLNRALANLNHICEALDLEKSRICSKERSRDVLTIRQSLAYIYYIEYGLSLVSIGKIFNRDHATIINNIKRVKDAIWLYEKRGVDSSNTINSLNTICELVGVNKVKTQAVS